MMIFDDRAGWRSPLYPCRTWRGATLTSLATLSLYGLLAIGSVAADEAPAIAVASSLRGAWPILATAWRSDLPDLTVRPTFGASNTLARQITHGAPFELFLSADDAAVEHLPDAVKDGLPPVSYATGRLALVLRDAAPGKARPIDPGSRTLAGPLDEPLSGPLAGLAARLDAEPTLRLALPNPDHAPYGRAAREALEQSGLWPVSTERLVRGENAAQTLQFLLSGAVDAALLPYSLVVDVVARDLDVQLIDSSLHAPLTHPLIVLANASPAARELATWLQSARARDIFVAAGFDLPH